MLDGTRLLYTPHPSLNPDPCQIYAMHALYHPPTPPPSLNPDPCRSAPSRSSKVGDGEVWGDLTLPLNLIIYKPNPNRPPKVGNCKAWSQLQVEITALQNKLADADKAP